MNPLRNLFGEISKYRLETVELLFLCFQAIFFSNLFPFALYKFVFFIPLFLFVYLFNLSHKAIGFSSLFSLLLCGLQKISALQVKTTYPSLLNHYFDLNSGICSHIDLLYEKDTANFIKTLVFGSKQSEVYKFSIGLGISHLLVVSGIHIHGIKKFIVKGPKTKFLFFFFLIFYGACLRFTVPILRVLLSLIFFKSKDKYRTGTYCVLIAPFFNVGIYKSISFLLSFLIPLLFLLVKEFKLNRVNTGILNFFIAFIYSSLLLLPYTKTINPSSFLPILLLSNLILIFYLYFLFTGFLVFLAPIHTLLAKLTLVLFNGTNSFTMPLRLEFGGFECSGFAISLCASIFFIYLYRCLKFSSQGMLDY